VQNGSYPAVPLSGLKGHYEPFQIVKHAPKVEIYSGQPRKNVCDFVLPLNLLCLAGECAEILELPICRPKLYLHFADFLQEVKGLFCRGSRSVHGPVHVLKHFDPSVEC
jgi:hypothetical protein